MTYMTHRPELLAFGSSIDRALSEFAMMGVGSGQAMTAIEAAVTESRSLGAPPTASIRRCWERAKDRWLDGLEPIEMTDQDRRGSKTELP